MCGVYVGIRGDHPAVAICRIPLLFVSYVFIAFWRFLYFSSVFLCVASFPYLS
jgi:hypothetical protein